MATKFVTANTSAANVTQFLKQTRPQRAGEADISLVIVRRLKAGPRRIDELIDAAGGGLTPLLSALQTLEEEQIVEVSTVSGERQYALTGVGQSLAAKL
jgi:DNA-binding HxlR family transcriptional regulator